MNTSDPTARLLSNSFRAVRLIALNEGLPESGLDHGPFVVAQRGIDPEDPELVVRDFLLARDGTWIPTTAWCAMPAQARHDIACFPAAGDVMGLLQNLPPKPVIRLDPAPPAPEPGQPEIPDTPVDPCLLNLLQPRGATDRSIRPGSFLTYQSP